MKKMDRVVKYDKTFQLRFEEYKDIFDDSCRTIWEVKRNLSAYLELEMDHCGWQAIWKVPRITCEDLKLPFPTFVLVFVVNMNCLKQVAEVRVLHKQAYVDIDEVHVVPLAQLWLTLVQDKTVALNLDSTGNALDVLQFFYANLFMPWDDDDNGNWIENHLEQRLRLFYDFKNGLLPQSIAERLKYLLAEAKRVHAKFLTMQKRLKEQNVDFDDDTNDTISEIVELQVRKMEIQKEFELLENPIVRKVFIKRQQTLKLNETPTDKRFWLVCEGTYESCTLFFNKLHTQYPNETFKTAINLTSVLENPDTIDLIALSAGEHKIKDFGCLNMTATIKSLDEKDNTVINSTSESIMFDLSGTITFENLTIDASKSQCAMLIRNGDVVLKNCKIFGDNLSTTHQGFIVLKESSLEMVDCYIIGFGTGIVGNSNSNVKLRNCEIRSVGYGFKIHDDCMVEMEGCMFFGCKEYAVLLETDYSHLYGNEEVGDFSILNNIPDIKISDTRGANNSKGNVMICESFKVNPMYDVFSHPSVLNKTVLLDLDSTDSGEDSADFNNTVIEIDGN